MADKNSPHTPVEALRLGAMDYIIKPFREAEVLAAVERCMTHIRLQRERNFLSARLKATNQQLRAR